MAVSGIVTGGLLVSPSKIITNGLFSSSVSNVTGPAKWAAGEVYQPGFRQGEVYHPGFREGEVYHPGFQAGQKVIE